MAPQPGSGRGSMLCSRGLLTFSARSVMNSGDLLENSFHGSSDNPAEATPGANVPAGRVVG
jgi:hypothetical protein